MTEFGTFVINGTERVVVTPIAPSFLLVSFMMIMIKEKHIHRVENTHPPG